MVPLVFVESSGLVCGEGGFVLFKAGGFSWFGASDFERFLQDPVLHTKEVYWMLSEEQRSKLDEIRERVVVADGRSSGPGTERSGRFDANP